MNPIIIGYGAAVVWIILPIVYLATAPDWHKTRTGRALVWLLASTSLLFVLLLTSRIFGDYWFKGWVHGGIYTAVLYAGVRLSILFIHLRIDLERRFRREDQAARDLEEAGK